MYWINYCAVIILKKLSLLKSLKLKIADYCIKNFNVWKSVMPFRNCRSQLTSWELPACRQHSCTRAGRVANLIQNHWSKFANFDQKMIFGCDFLMMLGHFILLTTKWKMSKKLFFYRMYELRAASRVPS